QHVLELAIERGVSARLVVRALQLIDRGDQRLGHVAPAENAETVSHGGGHVGIEVVTASRNARIRDGSLMPGALSTPDETSTTSGDSAAIARATFSGRRPPARMMGLRGDRILANASVSSSHGIAVPVPPRAP